MDKTKFTANPQLDSEGFLDTAAACRGCTPEEMCPRSGHCERYASPLRDNPSAFGLVYGMGSRQALVKGIWPWLQPNMSHVQIKRDLVERRHRARAANEPGIKVDDVFTTEQAALALKAIQHVTDAARCQGCTPEACTWADLSDEEIEAQHRHWQTMGNGWSGA